MLDAPPTSNRCKRPSLTLKIAILGSRGIPANYGGTETVAEIMSPIFQQLGHTVTVYSPDEHPYTGATWRGIQLKRIFNRESKLGIWGTLIYDFLCLKDAVASEFDIILELGNVPCAIFFPFFRQRNSKLITNMDGLEWMRSKWPRPIQLWLRANQRLAAQCLNENRHPLHRLVDRLPTAGRVQQQHGSLLLAELERLGIGLLADVSDSVDRRDAPWFGRHRRCRR